MLKRSLRETQEVNCPHHDLDTSIDTRLLFDLFLKQKENRKFTKITTSTTFLSRQRVTEHPVNMKQHDNFSTPYFSQLSYFKKLCLRFLSFAVSAYSDSVKIINF